MILNDYSWRSYISSPGPVNRAKCTNFFYYVHAFNIYY